jgi:N-acetylmuramic acid 6-phosphate etherase
VEDFENRAFSVMAGGDYALIKSVEGFEDFAEFGRKQLGDLEVSSKDVVFAITEGGETSFVIGTAWKGVDAGAKVYFVYNNPDDVLVQSVQRSREVIQDSRIDKLNLTTGPMAITGSTRMQATSIQLCALLTVLEMVIGDLNGRSSSVATIPKLFLETLEEMYATLRSPAVLSQLAGLVLLEESVYRAGHKINYYAGRFGIDVLTDTTERSPTYCTPPFRKFDDQVATESWAFLFLPELETPRAWEQILKRPPQCVEWSERDVSELVGEQQAARTYSVVRKISRAELMRFRIGLDGLEYRKAEQGDTAVGIFSEHEDDAHLANLFSQSIRGQGVIGFGRTGSIASLLDHLARREAGLKAVYVPVPAVDFALDGVTRVGVKLLLNALSTCTMVRLGRVMGNTMVWVVPSNLKLIDRSTRYVQRLAGLTYEAANRLLFEVIEYVEPRMKADQAYPPVVGLAVLRARYKLTNEAAEERFLTETRQSLAAPAPRQGP